MKHTLTTRTIVLIAVIVIVFSNMSLTVSATPLPSFPVPRGTTTINPTPYFIVYRAIYYDYRGKLRSATPSLAQEFLSEIDGKTYSVEILAELINEKISVLAGILLDGFDELDYRLRNYTRIDEYELWCNRLTEVYEQEAYKLSDLYEQEALKSMVY